MSQSGRGVALICGLLLASPARADTWYEAYDRAEQALAREQWSAAVAELNAALAARPGSGTNLRTYGMRFVDYFPYLKLGIAYYHLGQSDAALAAFESEERQGELARSATARALLADYRGRITSRQAQEVEARELRARAIVTENLTLARRLEGEGRTEEALAALGRALAVAPDHAEAGEARQRLLGQLAEHQRSQGRPERGAEPAPTAVAPQAAPAHEAAQSPERPAAEPRREMPADGVAEQAAVDERIKPLLAEAERRLSAGEFEAALAAANRALALDPANEAALRHLSQAYARLSEDLLAPDSSPPTIVLEGAPPRGVALAVSAPDLVLAGSVYDNSAVEVSLLAAGQALAPLAVSTRELSGVRITSFRSQLRLAPGVTRLRVVAVDRAGNRAELEQAVEYAVPFVRSPSFPLALAAGVAAFGGAWQLRRVRRRKRLLRGRFNPYVAGSPIFDPQRFFGRAELTDYVLRRISNNSIMLYGERRIGKTSFQHQLKRRLAALGDPEHEFYPVYVDLQGTPQEKFFGTLAGEVFHELSPKLGGLEPPAELAGDSYSYADFVQDVQRILGALKARSAKKVKLVLLIDEVDELNHYDPRINQRLRSLFMRAFADNLVAVVSGVGIKKQWEREGSPWYNFFQEIEVRPFDPAEARALIETPVKGIFRFEAGVADEIVRRTGAKPYLIQRLCSGLVDRMHTEGRREITRADLEAACQVERL